MIHQHIFAGPKPGMSEADFQNYWLNVHATNYASKIRQIRRYSISSRLRLAGDDTRLPFGGVAEIWLENETEQLASLQSPEFLNGARLDEPRWAAFWNTLVLDTTAHALLPPGGPNSPSPPTEFKVFVLLKRRSGSTIEDFRRISLERHPDIAWKVPGLRRLRVCHTPDSGYILGEPRFDAVVQYCFDDRLSLERALDASEYQNAISDLKMFTEARYVFHLCGQEHWVIGPEARPRSTDPVQDSTKGTTLMIQPPTEDISAQTYEVARRWFDALTQGNISAAFACLAEDVEWINYTPVPGYNTDMPWIGTYRGADAVKKSFEVFVSIAQVKVEQLISLVVQGQEAAGLIHEISTVKKTGMDFEIEFVQWLTIRGGKIVRWKSYTDPSPIVRAIRGT